MVYAVDNAWSSKRPDFDGIQRQVLSSEPPRAKDIFGQIEYCKTWGGGRKQLYSYDVLQYIQRKSNSFIVTGTFFEKLSKLAPKPEYHCPRFIAATIKTASTRGTGEKGFANHLKVSDIATINRQQAMCKQADAYMERAEKIVSAIDDPDQKLRLTVSRGDMECDLVDLVFGKTDVKCTADALEAIANAWVAAAVTGGPTTIPDNTATPASTATSADHGADLFDASGCIMQQSMQNQGIKAGILLTNKKATEECQWEVKYVNDDGSVGMASVLKDGALADAITVVQPKDMSSYSIVDRAVRFSLSKMVRPTLKFKNDDVEAGHSFQEPYLKAVATTALMMVFTGSNRDKKLETQLTPSVRVRTLADLSDEAFVPFGVIGKSTSEDSDLAISLHQCGVHIASFLVGKPASLFKDDGLDLEFWRVRESDDDEKANMKRSKVAYTFTPSKVGSIKCSDYAFDVSVPCIMPSKAIKAGDELVLKVAKKAAKEQEYVIVRTASHPSGERASKVQKAK